MHYLTNGQAHSQTWIITNEVNLLLCVLRTITKASVQVLLEHEGQSDVLGIEWCDDGMVWWLPPEDIQYVCISGEYIQCKREVAMARGD
jgi:hypothetical protein